MSRHRACALLLLLLAACLPSDPPSIEAERPVVGEGEDCGSEVDCEAGLSCFDAACTRRCGPIAELCADAPCSSIKDACSGEALDCLALDLCGERSQSCALDRSGCCSSACETVGCGQPSCDRLCVDACGRPEQLFPELDPDVEPIDRPGRRSHPAFASDGLGRALLFGGYRSEVDEATGATRERFLADTWSFTSSDGTWTPLEQGCDGPPPSPRRGSALLWWPPGERWLLLGGERVDAGPKPPDWIGDQPDYSHATNEVWAFADGCWAPFVTGEPQPEPFTFAAAAWDPVRLELVLFSGWSEGTTWVLPKEGRWERRESVRAPPARVKAAFAWDGGSLVLFGGRHYRSADESYLVGDTWRWDGEAWTPLEPNERLTPREAAQAAFFPGLGLLLFGGSNERGTMSDTTWLFHAGLSTWGAFPAVGIPTRGRHVLARTDEDSIVLGFGAESGHEKHDLWRFPLR